MAKNRKDTEAMVSGAGMFLSLITLLVEKVKENGGTIEDIYQLVMPAGSEKLWRIASIIVEADSKVLSLDEMIALGKYDWVNPEINDKNFPVDAVEKWDEETRLFHFGKTMSMDTVIAEMDKEGWMPASIWHLLYFGMKHPQFQTHFPIIALSSVWRHFCPFLCSRNSMRRLGLYGFVNTLDGDFRFLAVRN